MSILNLGNFDILDLLEADIINPSQLAALIKLSESRPPKRSWWRRLFRRPA